MAKTPCIVSDDNLAQTYAAVGFVVLFHRREVFISVILPNPHKMIQATCTRVKNVVFNTLGFYFFIIDLVVVSLHFVLMYLSEKGALQVPVLLASAVFRAAIGK